MRLAPLAALLVLLLAPLAAAQNPATQPGITLTLDRTSASVAAANETVVNATVTNTGSVAGTVSLSIDAPANWIVRPDQRNFAIAAGASQPVKITIDAPSAGQGAASGNLQIGAAFTESTPGPAARSATASASVALARVDPLPPPPDPAYTPEGLVVFALGSLLVIGFIALTETRRRRRIAADIAAAEEAERLAWIDRETGILVALEGHPVPWGPRRELLQRIVVKNASERPRVAHVGIERVTEGWIAAVSLPRVALEPGEETAMSVYLNPGVDLLGGTPAQVVITARPAEAREHAERIVLDLETPGVRIPITPTDADPTRPALRR